MKKRAPADYIQDPGREPTWEKEQMEKAVDCYFEVNNFNEAARRYDVPVSTLFYKVKTDSRYGKDPQKDEPKEEEEKKKAKTKPASTEEEEEDSGWNWLKKLATFALALYGGGRLLSRLFSSNSTDTQTEKKLSGTGKEKIEVASCWYRQVEENLRKITGLTDPFARKVQPRHIAEAVADGLGVDKGEINRNLLEKLARDWQDPGPLNEEIDLGKHRTVPASRVSPDWKSKLNQFAEDRDLKVRAYLKHEKDSWAILTSSGKVVGYFPGVATAKEWMKARGWDYPKNFG